MSGCLCSRLEPRLLRFRSADETWATSSLSEDQADMIIGAMQSMTGELWLVCRRKARLVSGIAAASMALQLNKHLRTARSCAAARRWPYAHDTEFPR